MPRPSPWGITDNMLPIVQILKPAEKKQRFLSPGVRKM